MTHGFTVIQGGRTGAASDAVPDAPQGLRVDFHRAGSVDDGAVAAWRALMTRNAITDPRADPDYVLSAARHQSGGRTLAFALAWDRDGTGREALQGVVPMAMPHPIWGRAEARLWQPPGLPHPAAALIDGARAEAVHAAVRGRLAGLRRPLRLGSPARAPARGDARSDGRRIVPADCVIGVRPADEGAAGEFEQVSDPALVPAAVEAFLVLDAQQAARPIIADPSEASMVRVVTRLFGRRGQVRIDLRRRAGNLVAGTLHLGAGACAVAWRHVARA